MPGPVSQSFNPFDGSLKRNWHAKLRSSGFRYIVFKVPDVFSALNAQEIELLDMMLAKIEGHRESQGKVPAHSYWVFARHWPGADQIKSLMEKLFGHEVGGPY
jgi:hypothetical protein